MSPVNCWLIDSLQSVALTNFINSIIIICNRINGFECELTVRAANWIIMKPFEALIDNISVCIFFSSSSCNQSFISNVWC